ncbi:MAG: sigma-70 family RNA polymerase sigma factor [Acidobacteria bacterium]|nr:sigma-70 family RNA polymerase sigma factor [Acidobacteriota bacterium]
MRRAGNLNDVRDTEMKSIADLYQGYYASVYSTALRITGNPADAEDALQTVFLRVLNHEWQNSAYPPEAYFRRAAANAALDLLRRRRSHKETPLEEASAEYSAEDAALLKERLRRALASLEVDDAAMFSLRYIEGMSNGEIADLYRQEKNNVAVRLHRIRQTLKEKMER